MDKLALGFILFAAGLMVGLSMNRGEKPQPQPYKPFNPDPRMRDGQWIH